MILDPLDKIFWLHILRTRVAHSRHALHLALWRLGRRLHICGWKFGLDFQGSVAISALLAQDERWGAQEKKHHSLM